MAGKVTNYYLAEDSVPLPPRNAEVFTTACDYCIVGCGYKVYRWPIGREGGPRANQNALGVDFPTGIMSGGWVSPNMHNIIMVNGRPHHVIVMPDKDAKVVNVGGNHSIRGGVLAKKLYNPNELDRTFRDDEVAGKQCGVRAAGPWYIRHLVDAGRAPVKDVQLELSRRAALAVALDLSQADGNRFVFLRIKIPVDVDLHVD